MSKFLNPDRKTVFGELAEVIVDAWPAPHLIARDGDAIGAAIVAYAAKWKDHPDFPPAPWDPRRGEIHLRDLDAPQEAADEAPRYRLKAFGAVNGVLYLAGTEIEWSHWLNRNNANLTANFEPLNESARRVHAYTVKFLAGRQMPGQPFALGKLNLPNPALFGKPEPETHRGAVGGPALLAKAIA